MSDKHELSAVDERIEWLRRKVYEISEYSLTADASAVTLQRMAELRNHREELEQLLYLRNLVQQNSETKITTWQITILSVFSLMSLVIAFLSIWMVGK